MVVLVTHYYSSRFLLKAFLGHTAEIDDVLRRKGPGNGEVIVLERAASGKYVLAQRLIPTESGMQDGEVQHAQWWKNFPEDTKKQQRLADLVHSDAKAACR